jgi:hypothetical protein
MRLRLQDDSLRNSHFSLCVLRGSGGMPRRRRAARRPDDRQRWQSVRYDLVSHRERFQTHPTRSAYNHLQIPMRVHRMPRWPHAKRPAYDRHGWQFLWHSSTRWHWHLRECAGMRSRLPTYTQRNSNPDPRLSRHRWLSSSLWSEPDDPWIFRRHGF